LGGIVGELENPKSKLALEIGLCKIDGFEKVGRRGYKNDPTTNMPQIHHESSCTGNKAEDLHHHVQNHNIDISLVKTNTLTYCPWSVTPLQDSMRSLLAHITSWEFNTPPSRTMWKNMRLGPKGFMNSNIVSNLIYGIKYLGQHFHCFRKTEW
jgi:hypothetical protein